PSHSTACPNTSSSPCRPPPRSTLFPYTTLFRSAHRIGPVPPDQVRGAAVHGFEVRRAVTDVARGAQSDTAHRGAAEIAEHVAEEVLHHEHVEPFGTQHEVLRGGVGVAVLQFHFRELRRHLRHHLAEERVTAQHVALIDARHPTYPVGGCALSARGERERLARDPQRALPGGQERVSHRPAAAHTFAP